MQVGGHNQEPDWISWGRRWLSLQVWCWQSAQPSGTPISVRPLQRPEWDAEVDRSIQIARRVLSHLLAKCHTCSVKERSLVSTSDDDAPK